MTSVTTRSQARAAEQAAAASTEQPATDWWTATGQTPPPPQGTWSRYDPSAGLAQDVNDYAPQGYAGDYAYSTNETQNRLQHMLGQSYDTSLPSVYKSGGIDVVAPDMRLGARRLGARAQKRAADRAALGQTALTPQEIAARQDYMRALNPASGFFLDSGRKSGSTPLSRAQREARQDARAAMKRNYIASLDKTQAATLDQALKHYSAIHSGRTPQHYDRGTGRWVDDSTNYQTDRKALRNVKRRLPASITRPELLGILRDMQGTKYDAASFADKYGIDPARTGRSLSTLTPSDRKDVIARFMELVGVLNVKPVYDPRLLTADSAEEVYNPDDYNIEELDLDSNILTPAAVVVTTKFDRETRGGEVIPAGTVVAVGGYRLVEGSESTSRKRLQDMEYYKAYPTKAERKQVSQKYFNRVNYGVGTKSTRETGSKFLSEKVRQLFAAGGIPEAGKFTSGANIEDRPSWLTTDTTVWLKLATPAYNTLVSRTVELLFNFYIGPDIAGKLDVNRSMPERALYYALNGQEQQVSGSFSYDAQGYLAPSGGQPRAAVQSVGTALQQVAGPLSVEALGSTWMSSYLHPKVYAAAMRDATITALIKDAYNTRFGAQNPLQVFQSYIMPIIQVVMRFTMNPTFILLNQSKQVLPMSETQRTALLRNAGSSANVINVTARAWERDVRPTYKVSSRGYSFVFATGGSPLVGEIGWHNAAMYEV